MGREENPFHLLEPLIQIKVITRDQRGEKEGPLILLQSYEILNSNSQPARRDEGLQSQYQEIVF